ncbi:MAG: hypothetical protein PHG82_01800 [Candidatus Gracilibacteria bacterium]|nr:hypothetical protein [Candidatus Gracilibacteria bacterium]
MGIENYSEYKVKNGDSLTKIVVMNFGKETGFPISAIKGDKINWKDPIVKDFLQDTNKSALFWQKVNELYSQTKDYKTREKKGEKTTITYENWMGFDTPKSRLKKDKKRFSLLTGEKLKLARLRNELDPNNYINEALPISKVQSPLEISDKTSREKAIGETQEKIMSGDSEERKDTVDTALQIPQGQEIENLAESKKQAIENLEKGLYGSEVESLDESDLKLMIKNQKVGIDSITFGVDWEGTDEGSGENDASIIIKANDNLNYDLSIRNDNSYRYDVFKKQFIQMSEKETKNYLTNESGLNGILEIRKQILINRILHQMYRNHEIEDGLVKNHEKLFQKLMTSDEKKLRTIANWRDNESYDDSEHYSRFHNTFSYDVPTDILFDSYDKIMQIESQKDEKGNTINHIEDIIWDKKSNDVKLKIKNRISSETREEKIE